MVYGTVTAYNVVNPLTGKHLGGSVAPISFIGKAGYIALTAFVLNVIVAAVVTLALRAAKVPEGVDETRPEDYRADAGDPSVRPLPELTETA